MELIGLTAEEASARLHKEGFNRLPGNAPKPLMAIVASVGSEPMFLMLLFAGGIYLLLGDRTEAAFLLASVFVVIFISLAQERKTQRALEALRDLSAPRALVIRDGREQRISGQEVVRGDLLKLHEGDRIAADCILIAGSVSVDESLLSGEAVPALKLPSLDYDTAYEAAPLELSRAEGSPSLFASTVVTKGAGVAKVSAVGIHTAVGRIGQSLNQMDTRPSGLELASRRIVWQLTAAGLLVAAVLFLLSWSWAKRPLLESLLGAVALAMAVLPEEIPVVLTVFLALGAWRMSKKKVLTRQVPALEALGAITILAVDKTGTITQNRMKVAELSVEHGYFHENKEDFLPERFRELSRYAALACPADPFDPMERAIHHFTQRWMKGLGLDVGNLRLDHTYELSAGVLAMTNVYSDERSPNRLIATKGAPEAVLSLCHLTQEARDAIQYQATAMAETGLRVLGVAKGSWSGATLPENQHDLELTFVGLVGFTDPPRPEVMAAISECRSAGIRLIMMTGDHPSTAKAIGTQVGLSTSPAVLTGAEAAQFDDRELAEKLQRVDICARLAPEQKLRLVRLLQDSGEVVAMTGDGVNDAPALQAANVGIAMGERGTDVAREAADLVLLDDSFASIVLSIKQGRRIYDNITSATRFIFAVHVPIVTLALFPVFFDWPILLLPLHIVLFELIIDPSCSIVFEAQPESQTIMKRPPRELGDSPFAPSSIGYALVQGIGISAILLLGYWVLGHQLAISEEQQRLLIFVSLVIGILLLVFANRNQFVPLYVSVFTMDRAVRSLTALVGLMLAIITVLPAANRILGFQRPSLIGLAYAMIIVCFILLWLEALRRTRRSRQV